MCEAYLVNFVVHFASNGFHLLTALSFHGCFFQLKIFPHDFANGWAGYSHWLDLELKKNTTLFARKSNCCLREEKQEF